VSSDHFTARGAEDYGKLLDFCAKRMNQQKTAMSPFLVLELLIQAEKDT
jgi:hypothetical protein